MTDKDSLTCFRILVFGKVQGVYFRASAKEIADSFDLVGYARNVPDGSVEIVAQGEKWKLDNFIHWMDNSNLLAKIEKITVKEIKPSDFTEFQVVN